MRTALERSSSGVSTFGERVNKKIELEATIFTHEARSLLRPEGPAWNRPDRKVGIGKGSRKERRRCGTKPDANRLYLRCIWSAAPSALITFPNLIPTSRSGLLNAGPSGLMNVLLHTWFWEHWSLRSDVSRLIPLLRTHKNVSITRPAKPTTAATGRACHKI